MNVVWPAVQENDGRPIGGTGLGVTHIQNAGVDLLQWTKRRICSRLDCRHLCLRSLCCRRTDHSELSGSDGYRGGAKEAPSILVDFDRELDRIHWVASMIACCGGSAERERKGLHVRIEKLDFELAIDNGLR